MRGEPQGCPKSLLVIPRLPVPKVDGHAGPTYSGFFGGGSGILTGGTPTGAGAGITAPTVVPQQPQVLTWLVPQQADATEPQQPQWAIWPPWQPCLWKSPPWAWP